MRCPERAGTARDSCARIGIENLERADRSDHHGNPELASEHFGGWIDMGDVAQYAWPEGDLVQRHSVAAHRGLGFRGANDITPGILVQLGAGLPHEFVQVLVFLAAGAELDIARRWNGGPVIHGVSSPDFGGTLAADKAEKLPP